MTDSHPPGDINELMPLLAVPPANSTWAHRAACRGLPTSQFFPADDDRGAIAQTADVCGVCPVRVECLAWGLHHEKFGIWGGLPASYFPALRRALRSSDSTAGGV